MTTAVECLKSNLVGFKVKKYYFHAIYWKVKSYKLKLTFRHSCPVCSFLAYIYFFKQLINFA